MATSSINFVPGDRWRALIVYFELRLEFSRRLRWTRSFASGALFEAVQERSKGADMGGVIAYKIEAKKGMSGGCLCS